MENQWECDRRLYNNIYLGMSYHSYDTVLSFKELVLWTFETAWFTSQWLEGRKVGARGRRRRWRRRRRRGGRGRHFESGRPFTFHCGALFIGLEVSRFVLIVELRCETDLGFSLTENLDLWFNSIAEMRLWTRLKKLIFWFLYVFNIVIKVHGHLFEIES